LSLWLTSFKDLLESCKQTENMSSKASDKNVSRDDFIQFLIAELGSQKQSQGNVDGFFTGKALSTAEIYQKLCFDYPLVNDPDFRYFVDEICALRKGHLLNDVDFPSKFNFNEKFMSNLSYFVFHDENGSTKERKEIIGILIKEIYLEYPSHLLSLTQKEISQYLNPVSAILYNLESPVKTEKSLSWHEILLLFKDYLLQANSSLLTTGLKSLLEHPPSPQLDNNKGEKKNNVLSFHSLLSVIKLLKETISYQKATNSSSSSSPNNNKDKKKKIKTLSEYLLSLDFFPSSTSSKSAALSLEESQILMKNFTVIKELLSHLIYVVVDLLCQYPVYFTIYFPLLADIMLEKESFQTAADLPIGLFYGNYLFIFSVCKNINQFFASEEEFLSLQSFSSHGKASSTTSHSKSPKETAKHGEDDDDKTTVTHKKDSEKADPRPVMNGNLLKGMKETIRKFFIAENHLTSLMQFLEAVLEENQKRAGKEEEQDLEKLLEVYSSFLDLGELLVGGPRVVSSITKQIYQQLLSSRLLIQLLMIYQKIVSHYLSYSSSSASSQQNSNTYWNYSVRLTRLFTTAILRDETVLTFIAEFPELNKSWMQLSQRMKMEKDSNSESLQLVVNSSETVISHHSSSMIWNISFGISLSYVLYLRLPSSSPFSSFWNEFLHLSTAQLLKDLSFFEKKENLLFLENHEDDEENERKRIEKELQELQQEWEEKNQRSQNAVQTEENELVPAVDHQQNQGTIHHSSTTMVSTASAVAEVDGNSDTVVKTTTTTTTNKTVVLASSTTTTTTTTSVVVPAAIIALENQLQSLNQQQFSYRQRHNQIKQSLVKYLESLQFLCLIMNQEEFSLIRSLKGKSDPKIETIFQFMNSFFQELLSKLKKIRQIFQENPKLDSWILETCEKIMKSVKIVFSLLEGNTSNKTD
jgi:flagellar motility protein MotE (MotC chaperone)